MYARRRSHDYYKEKIADRLRASGCLVETEVRVVLQREAEERHRSGRTKADIAVMLRQMFPEIVILEVKVKAEEVTTKQIETLTDKGRYANKVYFCLPKGEYLKDVALRCRFGGVGLCTVDSPDSGGPEGRLTLIVDSLVNKRPLRWYEFLMRLERRGYVLA